jgi:GGDEF domain-containing protein
MLMQQLAVRDEIDVKSGMWAEVHKNLVSAIAAGDVAALRARLLGLFEHTQEETAARNLARHEEVDRSMANDNAAGLRGGGAAIQHVREMLASGRPGYVCLFHMSCLDVVGERFGAEGIQDCLMAVSAFLTQNMRVEDTVYHWSESSLLAICDRKVRQDILTAELNRMLSRNRDFTIKIGDRTIMLRIPVDLHLDPISHFASADELHRLTMERPQIDRALVR